MNLKCAIVDDEPLALGLLESYVNKTPFLELAGKYSSAVQAIKELPEKHIDLLFLDIQMPELNGLEFSKMVDFNTHSLHHRLRPIRHRRLQSQCAGLLAETHLLHRLSAGCQQGCTMVRTAATAKGRNSEYFRKERV